MDFLFNLEIHRSALSILVLNEEMNNWEAPIPMPTFDPEDPKYYVWNEATTSWVEASE
jgi:hypothetical protein